MGCEFAATCSACRHAFTACEGGGFEFNLLRCDTCGETASMPIEERKRSWLWRPVNAFRREKKCACGGRFSSDAPIRCPKCRSTNIELGQITAHYD